MNGEALTVPADQSGAGARCGRRRPALLAAALAGALTVITAGGLPSLAAAQATPESGAGCTITPLSDAELRQLLSPETVAAFAAMEGTPLALPPEPGAGPAAEPEVVAGVTDTAAEMVACANAGDRARLLALYSPAYLTLIWGGMLGETRTEAEIAAGAADLATPLPVETVDQDELLGVTAVETLPDGRVVATIDRRQVSTRSVYVLVDGRWRLDSEIPIALDGTPIA